MRVAIYGRVSTGHQVEQQTIEQQIERLTALVATHATEGWTLEPAHVFRDDGYSGASLARPGLDRLRDAIKGREVDRVLVTAPDRLARNYVHQMVLLEEWTRAGCNTEFLERPMSDDPHDNLLLQIRGAVAEYERTLIAERMRRGRLAKLRAGTLLPWTRAPYAYRLSPDRPRDPRGVTLDLAEAAIVAELFAMYREPAVSLLQLSMRLDARGVPTPSGAPRWSCATVRGILRNPTYTGQVCDEPGLCCPQQHGAPIFAACAGELRLLRSGVQGSDARAVRLLHLQRQAAEHLLASYDPLLLAPSTGGSARRAGLAGPLRVAERAGTARHGRRAGARRSVVATGAAGPTRSPAPRPGAPAAAHRAAYGCLSQGGDPARRIRAATARAGAAGERTG